MIVVSLFSKHKLKVALVLVFLSVKANNVITVTITG